MGKINILDKELIGKIAAGEVIERPASVVKELIENSMDADAQKIFIELREGGKSLIRVGDDGAGMTKEDVNISVERHTTSKIKELSDLLGIRSFGFRGEALASIAAVAELAIKTRTENSLVGTKLVHQANTQHIENIACPKGTIVEVKNLFYNIPARKKYLKGIEHELKEVADIVTRYALVFPEIHFKLIHENKIILDAPSTTNTLANISHIYGNNLARQLLQLDYITGEITIMGFISKPEYTKTNRDYQSLFINKRYIKNKIMTNAITDAYHTLLPVRRYPVAILNIEIEPDQVDVNVHPTKSEVKIAHESMVYHAVFDAVKKTLSGVDLIPDVGREKTYQDVLIQKREIKKKDLTKKYELPKGNQLMLKDSDEKIRKSNLPEMRIVGQLHKTYLIAESENSVFIIDQHAAQERVNYEKFMVELAKDNIPTQVLLEPFIIEIPPKDMELIKLNLGLLRKLGFNIEEFGANTILVKSYPVLVPTQDKQLVLDIIDELDLVKNKIEEEKERLLILKACKISIKANQNMALPEITKLIEELSYSESPYTCPHGRPVIIRLTLDDLEKMFKRK